MQHISTYQAKGDNDMGNKNTNLQMAKNAKDDEFYTTYETIEKEMVHYLEHFEGKTVLCNCDDPF